MQPTNKNFRSRTFHVRSSNRVRFGESSLSSHCSTLSKAVTPESTATVKSAGPAIYRIARREKSYGVHHLPIEPLLNTTTPVAGTMLPILPFLLTILFIPFGFAFSWVPTLYLTLWPVIMRTVGRETLVTHALILILFILFSDMSRQVILKLVSDCKRRWCIYVT